MSADILTFPGDGLPDRPISESEIDKLHSEAFRELESSLRDCVRMGEIAANLMSGAKNEDLTLSFAVFHLAEMLMSLEKEYDARWHGERSKPMSELTPKHVLVDLFGSGDFPAEVLDPVHAVEIVIQRLNDAGFKIESAGN
jgi:hypothetical protein